MDYNDSIYVAMFITLIIGYIMGYTSPFKNKNDDKDQL